jgi:transposase InsO family protein
MARTFAISSAGTRQVSNLRRFRGLICSRRRGPQFWPLSNQADGGYEGPQDNVKRVYRLYREEGLSLRLKRPRRNRAAKLRQPKQFSFAVNEVWSADFVADALFDGRKLRMLTVVDCYTRECLAIDVGQSLTGEDVVDSLNRICVQRAYPRRSRPTTAASSSPRPWTNGPTSAASSSTSGGRASRRTTRA